MERNELYLKTAFCCMACDGTIAPEELSLLKSMVTDDNLFKGLDIQGVINAYVSSINQEGELFLHHYLDEVKDANLDDESALKLIKIAIETIEEFKIIRPKGGGGTDFEIILKYVQEHMSENLPVSIIILTDGYAPFPDEKMTMGIPVLWLLNNEEVEPPWGKVARITV